MRSAVFIAPFVAAAYSATTMTTSQSVTLVPELSGSVTVTSTFTYSNPETKYLTETNSVGVVTGMPGASTVITNPAAVTSQPAVATIPAGESTGFHTLTINATAGLTSFTISVGKKTTTVIGGAHVSTVAGSSSATAGGAGPHHTGGSGGSHTGGSNGGSSGSASGSASPTKTGSGSASNVKVASAGMIGLGALFAALL